MPFAVFPSGLEQTSWCRGIKITARQFLSLNVLAITLTTGVILKGPKTLSWEERQFARHFKRQLGEGNCESKTVSRQWGDNFCCETSRCLAGPFAVFRSGFGISEWGLLERWRDVDPSART